MLSKVLKVLLERARLVIPPVGGSTRGFLLLLHLLGEVKQYDEVREECADTIARLIPLLHSRAERRLGNATWIA